MDTGQKIKDARLRAELTQDELALKLHVTRPLVWAYESGYRKPKLDTILKFAAALGVDPSDLIGDDLQKTYDIKQALDNRDGETLSKLLGGKVEFVDRDRVAEQKLLTAYRKIPEDLQKIVLNLVEAIANEQV